MGWTVISGEPPGGTYHLPRIELHTPNSESRGSDGSKKPDVIAYRDSYLLLIELKYRYDVSDVNKLNHMVGSADWRRSLTSAMVGRSIFERFEIPQRYQERFERGGGLQKCIGLGCEIPEIPPEYMGLQFKDGELLELRVGPEAAVPLDLMSSRD